MTDIYMMSHTISQKMILRQVLRSNVNGLAREVSEASPMFARHVLTLITTFVCPQGTYVVSNPIFYSSNLLILVLRCSINARRRKERNKGR